jgi:hypothetical protein
VVYFLDLELQRVGGSGFFLTSFIVERGVSSTGTGSLRLATVLVGSLDRGLSVFFSESTRESIPAAVATAAAAAAAFPLLERPTILPLSSPEGRLATVSEGRLATAER